MKNKRIDRKVLLWSIVATVILDENKMQYCLDNGITPDLFGVYKDIVMDNSLDVMTKAMSFDFDAKEFIITSDDKFVSSVKKYVELMRIDWEIDMANVVINAKEEDVIEAVSLTIVERSKWFFDSNDIYDDALKVVSERQKGINSTTPLGLANLDNLLGGGAMLGDLIVIGARAGMGKTTLAIHMMLEQFKKGKKVLFNTIDMSYTKTILMLALQMMGITVMEFNQGHLTQKEYEELKSIIKEFKESENIVIIKERDPASLAIKIELERPDFVIVDYIQVMKNGSDMQGIERITSTLKDVSSRMNILILALSQVVRDVEKRPNKQPTLSDFMYSSAIENNADIVITLMRPEYYGMNVDELGESVEGLLIIDAVKVRSGVTGAIETGFKNGLIVENKSELVNLDEDVPF